MSSDLRADIEAALTRLLKEIDDDDEHTRISRAVGLAIKYVAVKNKIEEGEGGNELDAPEDGDEAG